MGQVDETKQAQSNVDEDGFIKLTAVDINDPSLPEGAIEEINPLADAWERACPPPDGLYRVELHAGKQAYQLGKDDNGQPYYVVNVDCKIVENDEWGGTVFFAKYDTRLGMGKEISTLAGILTKFSVKVPSKVSHKALLLMWERVISQTPKIYCEGEWATWDTPKKQWLKRGMKNFPHTEDGIGYSHLVRNSQQDIVAAKFRPLKWFNKKEYMELMERQKSKKNMAVAMQQKPKAATAAADSVGTFEEITTTTPLVQPAARTKANAAPAPMPAPTPTPVGDDEFVIEE